MERASKCGWGCNPGAAIHANMIIGAKRRNHPPMRNCGWLRVFTIVLAVGVSIAAASSNAKPESAIVKIVRSTLDDFLIRTSNVEVRFSDGTSAVWTTAGNCTLPHVSLKGCVGWIEVDKSKVDVVAKNRRGEDKVIIRCVDGSRKEFTGDPEAPFIGKWEFADNDTAVAIQSSAYHGPRHYIKYDINTHKVKEEIATYVSYQELPSWARRISNERPGE